MRTIVHLSDLHFGRVDHALLEPLRRCIVGLGPDVVVVSGDLTQRARGAQFREARAFLDSLPHPQIVVPGNHDVPLYNVFKRFFAPLDNYKRFISADLEPTWIDDKIAVVAINTARSLTFKGGRINEEQAERVRSQLCSLPEALTKIVVSHHPFDLPAHFDDDHIAGRARMATRVFAGCGADILLAGHVHVSHAGNESEHRVKGFPALIVQAGTATSTRGRGELNSFNALRVERPQVTVDQYQWNSAAACFALAKSETFERAASDWIAKNQR